MVNTPFNNLSEKTPCLCITPVKLCSIYIYSVYNYVIPFTDATPSAVASFSDARCTAGGVCPNDPLVFTCEVNDAVLLRVILPTGEQDFISLGDTVDVVSLPDGFSAVSLVISEIDEFSRNITLILSIQNATLLNGGQITCDDTFLNKVAMAGCLLAGERSV